TEEWVCRSISITAQPPPSAGQAPGGRSSPLRRHPRDRLGVPPSAVGRGWRRPGQRLQVALVVAAGGGPAPVAAEQQPADLPVEHVGAGDEGDLGERLLLTGGLEAEGAVAQ